MNIKEQIEELLNRLKLNGHTREEIEKELNYSPNYIDQVLAKGETNKAGSNYKEVVQVRKNSAWYWCHILFVEAF